MRAVLKVSAMPALAIRMSMCVMLWVVRRVMRTERASVSEVLERVSRIRVLVGSMVRSLVVKLEGLLRMVPMTVMFGRARRVFIRPWPIPMMGGLFV